MKIQKRVYYSTVLSGVLGALLITQGIACSPGFNMKTEEVISDISVSPSVLTTASGNRNDIKVIPGTKTVSLVYSKQVLDQMTACLGVKTPSDQTIAMYGQKKGAISTYGTANTITSPMMMAVVSIAGEVCNDLLNQESTGPLRLFKDFNFQSTNLPDNGALRSAISRLSLSCWQRPVEAAETELLVDLAFKSVKNGEAKASRKSALLLCTSMLSSLDSLLN